MVNSLAAGRARALPIIAAKRIVVGRIYMLKEFLSDGWRDLWLLV